MLPKVTSIFEHRIYLLIKHKSSW